MTAKASLGNLARHYRRKGNIEKYENLIAFQKSFEVIYE
jgi:hypothetical protein